MASRTTAPRRNRVSPLGEILAVRRRGAWTGNRGCIHRGGAIVRDWANDHWLICTLSFRGRRHEQWVPNRLTWLYFADEAVAFAAGHRPCAACRRPAWTVYRDALGGARFDEIDRRLHGERLRRGSRQRQLHPVGWPELPDGAFVVEDGLPAVVLGRRLVPWAAPHGYASADARRRPRRGTAQLLTPPSTVAVLAAGYPVQIDSSVHG